MGHRCSPVPTPRASVPQEATCVGEHGEWGWGLWAGTAGAVGGGGSAGEGSYQQAALLRPQEARLHSGNDRVGASSASRAQPLPWLSPTCSPVALLPPLPSPPWKVQSQGLTHPEVHPDRATRSGDRDEEQGPVGAHPAGVGGMRWGTKAEEKN